MYSTTMTPVRVVVYFCGWAVSWWNKPVGAGASMRSEWMSSTASVSSIYGRDANGKTTIVIIYYCCIPIDKHLQDKGIFLSMGEVQFWHFIRAFWVGAEKSGSLPRLGNGRAYVFLCQVLHKKDKRKCLLKKKTHQKLKSAFHDSPDCTASKKTMLMSHSLK